MNLPDIKAKHYQITLTKQPLLIGIVNATPDSFFDQGEFFKVSSPEPAITRALKLLEDGADIIDIGGETAQPHSPVLNPQEEISRVVPVIEGLSQQTEKPISIDTYKPEVADAALAAGACIINDTSGLADPRLADVAAKHQAAIVCMHIPCHPKERICPGYDNPVQAIMDFWQEKISILKAAGINDEQIIVDPGLGFGKTASENFQLINALPELKQIRYPILFACSRRTFLGEHLGGLKPEERLAPTAAVNAIAIQNQVAMIRVHDVKFMYQLRETLSVINK